MHACMYVYVQVYAGNGPRGVTQTRNAYGASAELLLLMAGGAGEGVERHERQRIVATHILRRHHTLLHHRRERTHIREEGDALRVRDKGPILHGPWS